MSDLSFFIHISEIFAKYVPYYVLDENEKKIIDELENKIYKLINK